LLEQVSDARCADADEHLDELRAGDGEKWHARFARHSAREEGLAGARRPDKKHALRYAGAEAAVLLRILEELDHFLQLRLGLVDAGDIGERDAGLRLDVDLGAALADAHEAAAETRAHAFGEEEPDAEEDERRQHPRQEVAEECAFVDSRVLHAEPGQALGELGLDQVRHGHGLAAFAALQFPGDMAVGNRHLGNLVFLQQALEFAVRHDLDRLGPLPGFLDEEHGDEGEDDVGDVKAGAAFHFSLEYRADGPTFLEGKRKV